MNENHIQNRKFFFTFLSDTRERDREKGIEKEKKRHSSNNGNHGGGR